MEKPAKSKARTALEKITTGAALLGAVAATEVPADALAQTQQENRESVRLDAEAKSFVEEVSKQYLATDDARGRRNLRTVIETKYEAFANKLGFSAVDSDLKDTVLNELSKCAVSENPALQELQTILKGNPSLSPKQQEAVKNFFEKMQ